MGRIGIIIIGVLLSLRVHAQFTEIPTETTADLYEMVTHGDTLIMLGHPGYFAKYCVTTGDLTELSSPGITGYANVSFQVVGDNYYVLSKQIGAYEHNYILKSTDYGNSWDTLFHTPGLFYTMSMADSTFGVLGGAFGSHAITDGSDTVWALDTLACGVFMSSATFGDSTAILEGTDCSFITHDREFTWEDGFSAPYGSPQQTQFLNKDTIFSLSNYGSGGGDTYFRRSTNGGSGWINSPPCKINLLDYDCNSTLYMMQMNADGSGYILGYVGSVYYEPGGGTVDKASLFYTEDYGSNWTPYVTDIPEIMYAMEFLNDTTAFIGGENGLLYKWDLTVPLSNVLNTQEISANIGLQLFPNPFSKSTSFKLPTTSAELPVILYVYDQLGREIRTETIQKPEFTFYRNGLKAGVYYYRINDYTGKFIIAD